LVHTHGLVEKLHVDVGTGARPGAQRQFTCAQAVEPEPGQRREQRQQDDAVSESVMLGSFQCGARVQPGFFGGIELLLSLGLLQQQFFNFCLLVSA